MPLLPKPEKVASWLDSVIPTAPEGSQLALISDFWNDVLNRNPKGTAETRRILNEAAADVKRAGGSQSNLDQLKRDIDAQTSARPLYPGGVLPDVDFSEYLPDLSGPDWTALAVIFALGVVALFVFTRR